MKILKIMIVLIILMLSVGAVCAAENTTDIRSTNSQKVLQTSQNEVYASSEVSFTNLTDEITNADTFLELTKDYTFNDETDKYTGIYISKDNFVLNGKGHTIDAKFQTKIFVITGNNITISNLTLINGHNTEKNGGAIYSTGSLTLKNITFNNNRAEEGGAIYCENYTEITNCNFNNNVAEWGGSIYSTSNDTIISNSTYSNSMSKYAAAIYTEGNVSIVNSIFKNLHANETAGAITLKKFKYVEIKNCTFINTTSVRNGGAIFIDASFNKTAPAYIQYSTFINSSGDFGGALVQLNGELIMEGCTFVNNTAKYSGAAIYESFTSSYIGNSVFESNKIINEELFDGGAIYSDYSGLTLINSIFTNNTKNAIYSYASNLNITKNTFKDNGEAIHRVFGDENDSIVNNNINKDILVLNDTDYASVVSENSMKLELINNTINVTNIPARFDLRDWGWVTPVKDQGNMGSCWVFGEIGALESALIKATGVKYDLSENNLQNNMLAYSKYGENNMTEAGLPDQALSYLISWLGTFPTEYDTYDELGKLSPIITTDKNIHIQDVMLLKATKDLKDTTPYKKAIMTYGGINIGYYACEDKPYYNSNTSAQYQNNTTEANHEVVLVGWNDNFPKEKFLITPPGDGAWIIKNSWDTDWGDNGYAYISYYDPSILKDPYQLVFIIENTENYTTNYQTDLGGDLAIDEYPTNVSYKINYESFGNELISAVGTYFNDEGEPYSLEIYINSKLALTQNGTGPYRGFHTIKLEKEIPIKNSDNFTAIMTKQSIPKITNSRQHYLKNQSFVKNGEKWNDTALDFETVSLKVYTKCLAIYTEDLVKIYKNDSKFEANIGISNETVIFEINGRNYTRTSDENGTAKMVVNLEPGNYTIKTTFNGTTVENTITVLPTLIADNLVKYFRNASQFYIGLIDGEGNPVAGQNITMNINGVFYNRTTNENGTAKLNINLAPGEYILTAIDPLTGLQMSYNITVLPTLNATDLEMTYKDGSTFNVTVLDGQGNPLKDAAVTFNINGVFYTRYTDSHGIARLNINLMAGEYIITSEYDGMRIANTITIKD